MNKKRAVVLGVNSFSGNAYTNFLLKKDYKILSFSRSDIEKNYYLRFDKSNKNFKFYKKDINKDLRFIIETIKKFKPSFIINYAAQSMVGESWQNPEDWLKTNSYSLPIFYNEIFKLDTKSRIVHISTPEVYGDNKNKIYENDIYHPSTPYALSRVTADQYLKIMNKFKKLDYVSVRAANVYGECQKLYRIIPKTIFACLSNEKLFLHGGGKSIRSFIHIDDVSSATYSAMTKGKSGEIFHITTEKMVSIRSLVQMICNKLNKDFKSIVKITEDRVGKDSSYNLSNRKIKKFGWKPKIELSEGLDRVIEWIQNNKSNFKKNELNYRHKK
jgi:dTDP-glucose 4,6-dehydratase